MFEQLYATLMGVDPWILYGAVGLFTLLECSLFVGSLVPGDAVVLLAASTVLGPEEFALLLAVATAGSLGGEVLGYLIGRRWGGGVRSSRLGQRLGEHRWMRTETYLAERGGKAILGARFISFVHAFAPVVAGTLRMPFRKFVTWSAAGALLWSSIYVTAGTLAGASWRYLGDRIGTASYLLSGAVGLVFLVVWALRRRRARLAGSTPPDSSDVTSPVDRTPSRG